MNNEPNISHLSIQNNIFYCAYCGAQITEGRQCIEVDFIEYEIIDNLICDDCYEDFEIDCYHT